MDTRFVETRFEALDAIGNALQEGRINFAEAIKLRDLARSGRIKEVKDRLMSRFSGEGQHETTLGQAQTRVAQVLVT